MENLEELKKNSHLIGGLQEDNTRLVNGVKIHQIEEKTQKDRDLNEAINLWRMRKL